MRAITVFEPPSERGGGEEGREVTVVKASIAVGVEKVPHSAYSIRDTHAGSNPTRVGLEMIMCLLFSYCVISSLY